MDLSKLREWVGTVTGKGDRWGRASREVCARLPGCQHHCTPPIYLHCTTRGRPTSSAAVVFAARPANCWLCVLRPVPGGESAGCVCLQCLFCGLCACCSLFACHAHCPHQVLAPIHCASSISFCFVCPCSFPCAPGSASCTTVCKLQDCPVGSCNTGLQRRPVRRFHLTLFTLFSCRVHDSGPWV